MEIEQAINYRNNEMDGIQNSGPSRHLKDDYPCYLFSFQENLKTETA